MSYDYDGIEVNGIVTFDCTKCEESNEDVEVVYFKGDREIYVNCLFCNHENVYYNEPPEYDPNN